jgi:3-hydroxyacyl-CoA dehydrogenase
MHEDEPETITLKNRFLTIATAKSLHQASKDLILAYFRKGQDEVV